MGLQAPAIMFLAFLPMLFIAAASYLNRADPDCGTTSARTQYFLLGAEIITLVIFSVVALGLVRRRPGVGPPPA